MEIETIGREANSLVTVQLCRTVCPRCREYVEFVLTEEDKQFEADAKYYRNLAERTKEEYIRLEKLLAKILG